MNCNNSKCKKEIRNYYTCNKCGLSFCTNACITEHTLEFHSNSSQVIGRPGMIRTSGMRSTFMKFGEYLKDIVDDPFYDFTNFEIYSDDDTQTIGAGAFGNVYLAKHKKDGKYYAIKHIEKIRITESGATVDIIIREISIHRRLIHEHIVRLYSHFEDENNFYLIMEFIKGGTLFNLIKRSKGIDEKKAFKYFIQTASAVNFLHENNLVHRDLKPENLLIDENDNIKLCDFGWCVDVSEGNRVTFCGTYEYMAPEIIQETPYNFSTDIWSLGILLYELIHGYSPFRSNSSENDDYTEIFKNIIKYNFKIEKDISKGCKDMISKLLTPDNKSRIKIKEIFLHPWVKEFEKAIKFEKLKQVQNEIQLDNSNSNSNSNSNFTKMIQNPAKQTSPKINLIMNKIDEKLKMVVSEKLHEKSGVIHCEGNSNSSSGVNGKNKSPPSLKDNSIPQLQAQSQSNTVIIELSGNVQNEDGESSFNLIGLDEPKYKPGPIMNLNINLKNIPENKENKMMQSSNEFSLFQKEGGQDNLFDTVLKKVQKKNIEKKKKKSDTVKKDSNGKLIPSPNESRIINNNSKEENEEDIQNIIVECEKKNSNNNVQKNQVIISGKQRQESPSVKDFCLFRDNEADVKTEKREEKRNDLETAKIEEDRNNDSNELLYSYNTFNPNTKQDLLAAVEILEKAQSIKSSNSSQPNVGKHEEGFWDMLFKPFHCGQNN